MFFQPYFWLIFDDPEVRKRHPEESEQVTLLVADLPRDDGNVGLEDLIRGLGLSASDEHHGASQPLPPPTEAEPSENTNDVPPEGYKTLDVRVLWSRVGPREVIRRKFSGFPSHPDENVPPGFAQGWLAFDGFSPESARGPQTLNLFSAREKWREIAPEDNNNVTTETVAVSPSSQESSVEEVEAETESSAETQAYIIPSREWVPIVPSTQHSQQRPKPMSSSSKSIRSKDIFNTSTFIKPVAAETAANTTDATSMPAGKEETTSKPLGAIKLSRRERILDLARQNARTPLPKLAEKPPPPPPTDTEKKESERQGKERTIRERLWRLVGGHF